MSEKLRLEAEFRDKGVSSGLKKIGGELALIKKTPGMTEATKWVGEFNDHTERFVRDGGGVKPKGFYIDKTADDVPSDAIEVASALLFAFSDKEQDHHYDVATATLVADPVVPPTAAELLAYANARQWAIATGGFSITLSGQVRSFSTSEISLTLMNGKFLRLTQLPAVATISWQFATGFEDVSAADFLKAAIAISDFVQATFDALNLIMAAVAAGTITTIAQIDAAGWPSPVAAA